MTTSARSRRFFAGVPDPIRYEGSTSGSPRAFKHYEATRVVSGRTMVEFVRYHEAGHTEPGGWWERALDWFDRFLK